MAASDKVMSFKDQYCEVGYVLHTALRKCCDSRPTSLAWNVVSLVGPAWTYYCQLVTKQLLAGEYPVQAASKAAIDLDGAFAARHEEGMEWLRQVDGPCQLQVLIFILEEFSDLDWECFVSYIDADFMKTLTE